MVKITGCILVVMDDFKNVLLLKLKTKRGQEEKWSLISRKLKGKEDCEKCIEKALKTSIKTLIFDLNKVKEVAIKIICFMLEILKKNQCLIKHIVIISG